MGTLNLQYTLQILFPVSTGPFALAGWLSLCLLQGQEQLRHWTGDEEGAATSGGSALLDTSPALGLSPQSLFPDWFVCELAHVDRCILLPPLPLLVSHCHCMASCHCESWPVSVCSFSLNWPFHSPALGLCSLAWLPSFARERGWGCR